MKPLSCMSSRDKNMRSSGQCDLDYAQNRE